MDTEGGDRLWLRPRPLRCRSGQARPPRNPLPRPARRLARSRSRLASPPGR